MGTIVCQDCEGTIAHFEDEKVTVLYGNVILRMRSHRAYKSPIIDRKWTAKSFRIINLGEMKNGNNRMPSM